MTSIKLGKLIMKEVAFTTLFFFACTYFVWKGMAWFPYSSGIPSKIIHFTYGEWLCGLLSGQVGYSGYYTGLKSSEGLLRLSWNTISLACIALLLSIALGGTLGIWRGSKRCGRFGTGMGRYIRSVFSVLVILVSGIPVFVVGFLLIDLDCLGKGRDIFALTLGGGSLASIVRSTELVLEKELRKPYCTALLTAGYPTVEGMFFPITSVTGQAFRNTLHILVPVWVGKLPLMISGAALTEVVFDRAGLGTALLESIVLHDLPRGMLIVLITFLLVRCVQVSNKVVMYMINPRAVT